MKRSKFSLSHTRLMSCNMGDLVPCSITEVLPGDSIQQNTSALVRCAPLLSPVMHPVHVRLHHWFVPNRILWDKWEDFITGGPDGMDASVFPTIESPASTGWLTGSLADYFGLTPDVPNMEVSALPFRAYAMIYNEWYRDQDLIDPIPMSIASGLDTTTNTGIQKCAWEKDYSTTALPWTQKGPEITLPLGQSALIKTTGTLVLNWVSMTLATYYASSPKLPMVFLSPWLQILLMLIWSQTFPPLLLSLSTISAKLSRFNVMKRPVPVMVHDILNISAIWVCVHLMLACNALNTLAAANKLSNSLKCLKPVPVKILRIQLVKCLVMVLVLLVLIVIAVSLKNTAT